MRVLQIHNTYKNRGGEDMIADIEVALLKSYAIEVETLRFLNDKINPTKILKNNHSDFLLSQKIKEFKPDVIHIHNLFYEATPSIINIAKQHKIPVVVTLHNYRLICTGALLMRNSEICTKCVQKTLPLAPMLHKCFQDSALKSLLLTTVTAYHKITKTWNKVDKYITLTPFAKERFLNSSLNISENQIVVKSNSVSDFGISNAESRNSNFLFVGRISKEKGIEVLSKAFQNSELKLEVIGDGPMLENWKEKALPNVTFHGHQNSDFVVDKLKKCKALIVPSICYEGLPTNILEAFSTGTPVICSDIDNLNTIVENNFNGYHFKNGNYISLLEIVEHYKLSDELIQNARYTFEKKYSNQKNMEALIQIYNEVISK